MVDELEKKRKDTAKTLFKKFKACGFNKEVLFQRFTPSTYEIKCYNYVYGCVFEKL